MGETIDRRHFLGAAAVSGTFTIVPRHVLGGDGHVAPSDKITLAQIGIGTEGLLELQQLLDHPRIQVVAVCDPNRDSNNYVEWSKGSILRAVRSCLRDPTWRQGETGCPGGREVGREIVDSYYSGHGHDRTPGKGSCRAFADFRELLESESDIDAVKIMTPDHVHATISIAAMKKGKHVLMHKPIANRMHEGRQVLKVASESKSATHMLAYGIGPRNGLIAERVKAGAIGTLREIHNWSTRPVWPQYPTIPQDTHPLPAGLDWNLWLGPAQDRPYHPCYTHTVFRGWYDFGGGAMADMGIYSLWPVFTELDLRSPVSAEAWGNATWTIDNNVSRRVKNNYSFPTACTLRFELPANGQRAPIDLFWYDGGQKPRFPREIEALGVRPQAEGILFVGDSGVISAGFLGDRPQLITKAGSEPLELGENRHSAGGFGQWIDACRGGPASRGRFENAAAITDAVNLGAVALRTGQRVEFDSEQMKITNSAIADKYLYRDYRPGWEM